MPELKGRQELFCREYLKDHDQTAAAIRAGYSERSAYNQGSRLMNNDEIRSRISELEQDIANVVGLTKHFLVSKLYEMIDADPRKVVAWARYESAPDQLDLGIDKPPELDDATATAVSEFRFTDQGPQVKLYDKLKAIQMACELQGLAVPSGSSKGGGSSAPDPSDPAPAQGMLILPEADLGADSDA